MASGFFSRLANLSENIPDEEEAPSIFSTGLFSFGQSDPAPAASPTTYPPQSSQAANALVGTDRSPHATQYERDTDHVQGVHGAAPSGSGGGGEIAVLQRRVSDLTKKLAEKTQQYKDLLDEATTVKAEFDAYRRKSEAQLRQERQLAQEDKRRLEELRQVGGRAGDVEEAYLKGLKDKVHEMELKLRDAAAETQKAVKRQREAEEMRKLLEKEKKDEIAELVERYEQLMERAVKRQQELEAQLTEDRARWTATQEVRESLEQEGDAIPMEREIAATASDAAESAVIRGEEHTDAMTMPAPASGTASADVPPTTPSHDGASPNATVVQLQKQISQLRSRVKELEQASALSEERTRRQLDEAAADALEGQKRLTEKTTELDELKSRYAELQSTLSAKEDEHSTREKDLLYQVRQLEDTVAKAKREKQELTQAAEKRRQEYEEALQAEKERAVLTNQRVDEVESASKEVVSSLEAQRSHYTAMLEARDATIAELDAIRRGLEQDLEELREDAREQADRLEEMRRELAQQALLVKDLEAKHMHAQRLLSLREEELQSREVERQRMRTMLREEEDAHAQSKHELAEITTRAAEQDATILELREALAAAQEEGGTRDARIDQRAARCAELEDALADKEAALAPLTDRVATLQTTNLKLREELTHATRRVEDLQQRLELLHSSSSAAVGAGEGASPFGTTSSRLSALSGASTDASAVKPTVLGSGNGGISVVASGVEGAAGTGGTGGYRYTLPPSSRERHLFVQDAWQSARRMTAQARSQRYKIVFGVVATLVVVFMVLSGFLTASSATTHDVARDVQSRLVRVELELDMCLARCPMPNRKERKERKEMKPEL